MSYFLMARPVMTGFGWMYERRDEFDADDFQSQDASDFIVAGSCLDKYGRPEQTLICRQYMDAYELTDATAKHTDCASEAI